MAKKIFDISPPKEKKEFLEKKPHFEISFPKIKIKKGLLLIPLFLIILGMVVHFVLAKVEIEIWPATEKRNFETKIIADIHSQEIDPTNQTIPAKIFETEKLVSQEFPASGKKSIKKRAEGIIRVYNNYSTQSQVLVATTRFVSTEGKLFRSIERVTIPGGKYEGGKFVPGYLDVKVRADQPGEDYNIGPSTFSIPGFAGTPLYTRFYGKSFQPMEGGEIKEVSIVSQKDLEEAEKFLIKKAREETELALKEKIPSEFDLLKEALETKILEVIPLAQAGQELEKFNFQVKAKSRAMVFKPEDIKNFLISFISLQLPVEKKVIPQSLKMDYSLQNINLESGQISLSLEGEVKIFSDLNKNLLRKGVAGKSLAETKIFLEDLPEINRAEIKVWPFWLRRIPEDLRKIEIRLNLD